MRKSLSALLFIFIFFNYQFLQSQTYQLTGNPVNTNGWSLVSNAIVSTDFVQLTADQGGLYGAIKLKILLILNIVINGKWSSIFELMETERQPTAEVMVLLSGICPIPQRVLSLVADWEFPQMPRV